ncbi:two-partner secretion domain-containing protein [Thiogranum longum]
MFVEQKQLFHWRRAKSHKREVSCCTRVAIGAMLVASSVATVQAAPTGGVVRDGSANITLGNDTVIQQFTKRVDIDWTGFDTTPTESVTFNQQLGSSAVAINRISGSRTQFDGILNAKGQIFLINQNGITIGNSARINVGSLLATTSDTAIPFDGGQGLNSSLDFTEAGNASIVNNGNITVSVGGFAVLAAPYVENNGFVRANLGQIELASTQDFTINVDLRGDNLITFDVPAEIIIGEEGPLGVTNTGTLQSRGGNVYLTAHMASNVVNSVVNLSGVVDADAFGSDPDGGTIMVASVGDIDIGGGADIHAVGGETVRASFEASDDINVGEEGDSASITIAAIDSGEAPGADAALSMQAGIDGTGSVTVHGNLGISAQASGSGQSGAIADAAIYGNNVTIHGDVSVNADASGVGSAGFATGASAALDIAASGGEPGGSSDVAIDGDITVAANAAGDGSVTTASADAVLLAAGELGMTGTADVSSTAAATGSAGGENADADAALVMLGGAEDPGLGDGDSSSTLAESVAALAHEVLANGAAALEGVASGDGGVSFTGDINVSATADFDGAGTDSIATGGSAQALATALVGAGDDVSMATETVAVNASANANLDSATSGDSLTSLADAEGDLLIGAGLNGSGDDTTATAASGDLSIVGDVTATAVQSATVNGASDPTTTSGTAVAINGLLARGDLTVEGSGPLASADPALVQEKFTAYQRCLDGSCDPVTAGSFPLGDAAPEFDRLAQLVLDAGGDINIIDGEPIPPAPTESAPNVVKVLAAYQTPEPIGPGWPGNMPLRFDAGGNMLPATAIGTTRPAPMAAMEIDIEAILLWGGDPSKLLPPTAAGGCVAAGQDFISVSSPDFYDRLVSSSCATGK